MMKKKIALFLLLFACAMIFESNALSKAKSKKSRQFIDLEGLDIQGMIDRPQTLYILKKSDLNFSENYDEYDYMGVIINTTYKEPF